MMVQRVDSHSRCKKQRCTRYGKSQLQLLMMIMPAVLLCFVFCYIPMFGIVIAFQKYNLIKGVLKSPWVGFDNFARFFNSMYAWRTIRNTLLLNVYSIAFAFPMPILFALIINEIRHATYKRVIQTISYLPHFISTVVLVGIVKLIFSNDGVINQAIQALGGEAVLFLAKPGWFRPIYIGSGVWQELGWGSIMYLAALNGVDVSLYEAAEIDGASRVQKIVHVSLPAIVPVICTMLILRLSSILSVGFEKVLLLYNSSTYETADVISTYLYRKSFESSYPDYGLSGAIGLLSSLVGGVFVFAGDRITKKLSGSGLF